MSVDNYTCQDCHERLTALLARVEVLEARSIRTVHRAVINPTDTAQGDRVVGYFVDAAVAHAAVKGKDYYGSDGRVGEVAVVVDGEGNVFELSPSKGKLTE